MVISEVSETTVSSETRTLEEGPGAPLDLEAGPSRAGRQRLLAGEAGPLFVCDWLRTLMVHFSVPPRLLQPEVPFPLDLRGGSAFVSLVFFSMSRLRPARGGSLSSWVSAPLASHPFLNLRTYVVRGTEPGIYFLAEWLPNRLAVWLGPRFFGLPYRHGRVQLHCDRETRTVRAGATDSSTGKSLYCSAQFTGNCLFRPAPAGSLPAFLMERYTAFTERHGRSGLFRVWHVPWPQQSTTSIQFSEPSLLAEAGPWSGATRLVGANYSPGLTGVWIGRPHRLADRSPGCPKRISDATPRGVEKSTH